MSKTNVTLYYPERHTPAVRRAVKSTLHYATPEFAIKGYHFTRAGIEDELNACFKQRDKHWIKEIFDELRVIVACSHPTLHTEFTYGLFELVYSAVLEDAFEASEPRAGPVFTIEHSKVGLYIPRLAHTDAFADFR